MATYHFNAQVVSRSCGASAVAGAAYRSGECLTDERTGEEHDHTARDDLDATEILAPRESPDWAQDRARLWNAVEQAERRVDAQVAREIRVAIPRELRPEDGRALVRDYAQRSFVDRGMVADIAFHGGESKNPHAHIMLTTRTLTPEGFGKKNREWNKKAHLVTWREDWAKTPTAPWRSTAAPSASTIGRSSRSGTRPCSAVTPRAPTSSTVTRRCARAARRG